MVSPELLSLRGGAWLGKNVRWLNQGRYWRIGPGHIPKPTQAWQRLLTRGYGENVPTLRIGPGRPVTWWNHIDLRFFGF
jgi:hypothetical protein